MHDGLLVQGAMFKSETISKEMIKFAGALSKVRGSSRFESLIASHHFRFQSHM